MKQLKWGIVGGAKIAEQQMIPAILESGDGIIIAIASRSGKATEMQKKFEIPSLVTDYDELFSMDAVDAVYIATPNSTHCELIKKAVSAGKHVLCEKPIVLKREELEEIFQLADHFNVYVMEAMMYRFHPQMKKCRELLQAGVIGDVVTMHSKFHFKLDNWESDIRTSNQLGGGALNDLGCYCINAACYLLKKEPQTIQVINSVHNDAEVDTHVSMQMHYASGEIVSADCSFHSPMNNEIEIIGTLGSIKIPHAFRPDLNDDVGELNVKTQSNEKKISLKGKSYVEQVQSFQKTLRFHGELPYSRGDMLTQASLLEKIFNKLNKE
ncbi:Gfo/Idh/MocA family protein [Sporosarcina obsidiansis]|uniref:Gfo/Idh/MocA family protein n=1 Tax=Sporosarcina obsidiansis TaxID=2660748 RepID=UPI00129AB8C6|nr:Gfo/Idh/MocA family oxidoreductase [Sporosarcina obsidiansis]